MAGVAMAITAVLIALLVTGGVSTTNSENPGDLRRVEGKEPRRHAGPPISASTADILDAAVHSQGNRLAFTLSTAADIPTELERSSLEFRFDISESGRPTWILSANVNVEPTAALASQASDYSATTIDGSLLGEVEIEGRTLTIEIDPSQIDDFPEEFEWALTSNLIAYRDVTGSTRAEDRFPDEGSIAV